SIRYTLDIGASGDSLTNRPHSKSRPSTIGRTSSNVVDIVTPPCPCTMTSVFSSVPETTGNRRATTVSTCQRRFQTGSPAILVQIGSVNVAFQLAFPHFRCCRDVVG